MSSFTLNSTSASNMVAANKIDPLPTDKSLWFVCKRTYLSYASKKDFQNHLTGTAGDLPVRPANAPATQFSYWHSLIKEFRTAKAEAWHFLVLITNNSTFSSLLTPFENDGTDPHAAWLAICNFYESNGNETQQQILLNRLKVRYEDLGDHKLSFLKIVDRLETTYHALAAHNEGLEEEQKVKITEVQKKNYLLEALTKIPIFEAIFQQIHSEITSPSYADLKLRLQNHVDYLQQRTVETTQANHRLNEKPEVVAVADMSTKALMIQIKKLTNQNNQLNKKLNNKNYNKNKNNKNYYKNNKNNKNSSLAPSKFNNFRPNNADSRDPPVHNSRDRPFLNNNQERPRLHCSHCNKDGHTVDFCFILHPELKHKRRNIRAHLVDVDTLPSEYRNDDGSDNESIMVHMVNLIDKPILLQDSVEISVAFSQFVPQNAPIFIIDSGATHPMCNNQSLFQDLKPLRRPIKVADNRTIYTTGIGSIGPLKDILLVPDLTYNLLSVGYLSSLGIDITFKSDGTVNASIQGKLIQIGKKNKGLYYTLPNLFSQLEIDNISSYFSYSPSICDIYHWRFAHINPQYIIKAKVNKLATGIDCPDTIKAFKKHSSFCEFCALAKSHRTSASSTPGSFHSLLKKRKNTDSQEVELNVSEDQLIKLQQRQNVLDQLKPLSKMAMDIKGPLPISIHKTKYILLFTCVLTRFRFIYFLASKDQTIDFIKILISDVKKVGKEVKCFKSDNGGEFVNTYVTNFFVENNIQHEKTSPYTPHQNGIAERSNRTITELAVSCILASKLPIFLWPYAFDSVIYVLNRMPNSFLSMESTPYIEVFKLIPDLSLLRVFGCDCFVNLPTHLQPSFGPRATKATFLGYSKDSLSYLVYFNSKVYKSGHVIFNEDLRIKDFIDNNHKSDFHEFVDVSLPHDFLFPNPTTISTENIIESTNRMSLTSNQLNSTPQEPPQLSIPTVLRRSQRIQSTATNLTYSPMSSVSINNAMANCFVSGNFYDSNFAIYDKKCSSPNFILSAFHATLTFEEAVNSPEKDEWIIAINKELKKLSDLNTWEVKERLPINRKAINYKWVLKQKYDMNQNLIYKARLTAMGCHQKPGFDFLETFSPVARMTAIRLILSLSTAENFILWQFDVESAFPNAKLSNEVEIYMKPPTSLKLPPDNVLQLKRALYGLKQSSREWHSLVKDILIQLKFHQTRSDSCLFVRRLNFSVTIIAVYVDDIIIASSSKSEIKYIYDQFSSRFTTKETKLTYCLALNISRSVDKLTISKNSYSDNILAKYGDLISHIPFQRIPMDVNLKLSRADCPKNDKEKLEMAKYPYRSIIGALNYLTVTLRADISFAVHNLARFMDNPGISHYNALLNLLAYLRDHPYGNITYYADSPSLSFLKMDKNRLYCFVDSDFASSDLDTRKSVTSYLIFLNGGLISWKSSLQKSNSSSSTEAEYKALHAASMEVVYLRNLLDELGFHQSKPSVIFEDNTSTIRATENPVEHSKLKHIDIKYHQIRDFTEKKQVKVLHISTVQQLADGLNKAQSGPRFEKDRSEYINLDDTSKFQH
jgi:hypothetical protein